MADNMVLDQMMRVATRGEDGLAKPILSDQDGIIYAQPHNYFNYKTLDYTVVGWYKVGAYDWVYGMDDLNNLYKSLDGGLTWGSPIDTLASSPRCGVYTQGCLLIWLSNGTLVRSINEGPFTVVLSGLLCPRSSAGIAVSTVDANKIMFVEYTTEDITVDLHVYYSANAGASWSIVMTKSHPTEVWHFHSVDFLANTSPKVEWVVTSGDSSLSVAWWSSMDDGATWEKIAGGFRDTSGNSQIFRTLGVKRVAGGTYIWGTDTFSQSYIMACKKEDLPTNGVLTDFVRKVQPTHGAVWALEGDGATLVAAAKTELSTYWGQYRNKIMVSLDSGGTWNSEYEFDGAIIGGGVLGIQGPDSSGNYYIHKTSPDNRSIKMTPKKNMQQRLGPIDQSKSRIVFDKTVLENITPNVNAAIYCSSGLSRAVFHPCIIVKNNTDAEVALSFTDHKGDVYQDATSGILTASISPGKNVMLQEGDQMIKSMIPKGAYIGVKAIDKNPTVGTVTVVVYGECLEPNDHRAL